MTIKRDPLDIAVDCAHGALSEVARIAERQDQLDLRRFADDARIELLTEWERAE